MGTRQLIPLVAIVMGSIGCVDELSPDGQWQITETIRNGDCGATQTTTSTRKWNVTNGGAKVIDADDPSAAYNGDFQCMIDNCTAAITGTVTVGTGSVVIQNFLMLDGQTNEITGNRTVDIKGSMPCSFTAPVTGKRYALP